MSKFPQVLKDDLGRDVKIQKADGSYTRISYWGGSSLVKIIFNHTPYDLSFSIYGKNGVVGSFENGKLNLLSPANNFYIRNNTISFRVKPDIRNTWKEKLIKNR